MQHKFAVNQQKTIRAAVQPPIILTDMLISASHANFRRLYYWPQADGLAFILITITAGPDMAYIEIRHQRHWLFAEKFQISELCACIYFEKL